MAKKYESNTDRILREIEERKAARAAQQAERTRLRDERKMARIGKEGIKRAVKKGTLAKNPDAVSVRNLPKPKGLLVGEPKPAGMLVGKPKPAGMLVGKPKPAGMLVGEPKPRGMLVGEPKRSGMLVGEPKPRGMLVGKPSRSTADAKPKAKPTPPGDMMGTTPPGGGTLSKKDVDEYSEAFASPDADKMYNLSEKNRRKDMNMLERAFDSIKVAGDRATADRRKRGLSDYDMNEEFYSKKGGRVGATMKKTRKSSVRKRAAKRGFGVETRGN